LPSDAEKQLHQRVSRLQVGFGLTLNYIRRFLVPTCKEHNIKTPWKGRMVGKAEKKLWLNFEENRKCQLRPIDDF
jgi:hypothetical protein